jgi:hypothetical protein
MRTRLLRINKKELPRLDTLHPTNSIPGSSPFNSSPLRQSDGAFSNMNDLVQNMLRQSQGNQSFELEPRDRNVFVDLPDIDDS